MSAGGDIDVFTGRDPQLSLSYNQLEKGNFYGESRAAAVGNAWVSAAAANRSYGFRGRVEGGVLHARVWTSESNRISCNGEVGAPGHLLIAFPGRTIDVTVRGESQSIALTVDARAVATRLSKAAATVLADCTVDHRFLPAGADVLASLGRQVRSALSTDTVSMAGPVAWSADTGRAYRQLLETLAAILNRAAPAAAAAPRRHASPLVRDALDYMAAHLAEPMTLQDLCRACGWSKRSMIYYFSDALGITPMAYFKLLRLNAVRRALKAADPRTTRVLDVAANYGFYHMGHFAVDYRALFGVLPSQSLNYTENRVPATLSA